MPVSRLPIAVPKSDSTSTGLRPTRSDTRPQTGENTNCASEKDATSRPTTAGEASKRSA
jgi:hypothetical protein